MNRHERDQYLTQPKLAERGWSLTMIQRLLGEPDKLAPNPRYRSGAPMRLYAAARVDLVEATPAFQAAAEMAARRGRIAKTAASAVAADLLAQVAVMPVSVTVLPLDKVTASAIVSYNLRRFDRYDAEPATKNSDPAFLARITVNHIRHRLTHYDDMLQAAYRKTGADALRAAVRARIFGAIEQAYPDLADECRRQLSRREAAPRSADS